MQNPCKYGLSNSFVITLIDAQMSKKDIIIVASL